MLIVSDSGHSFNVVAYLERLRRPQAALVSGLTLCSGYSHSIAYMLFLFGVYYLQLLRQA